MQLNYLHAREGALMLRAQADEAAQCKLPGAGIRFVDVRHELPDAWGVFRRDLDKVQ
jgi:hypothetical protein